MAFFVLCSAFVACSTDQNDTPDKPKSVPIYQGMTVSAVDNSSRVASASFSFAKNRLSSPVRGNPTDRDPGWWDGDKYGRGDDFGGEGVRLNRLYKQSVVTSATVLFGDADVQAQSLSWSYVWGDTPATERAFTSLTLWQGEQKVRDLDVAATTVDGLYTNCAYTLVAEYLVDGSTESIRLQFVTLAKQVPSVSLSDVVASQTGVRFVVNATDLDGVGAVTKVEIHSGTSWHITLATDASVCDKLLSDNGYTINVEYTYDLGDGNGKQTTYATC